LIVLEYQQFENSSVSYLSPTKEHHKCLIFLFITNHLFLFPFKPSGCQPVAYDTSAKPGKKKVQRGRVSTRSQDHLKRSASRPDTHDAPPLLANYALAKTSKTAASLPPISPCTTRTKTRTKTRPRLRSMEKIKGKRQIRIMFLLVCQDQRLHWQPMKFMLHRLMLRLQNCC
jgi:hypothetical protein